MINGSNRYLTEKQIRNFRPSSTLINLGTCIEFKFKHSLMAAGLNIIPYLKYPVSLERNIPTLDGILLLLASSAVQ